MRVASPRKEVAAAVHMVHLYGSERRALPWEGWERRTFTNTQTARLLRSQYLVVAGQDVGDGA